ncbi:MAG: FHA domain-containing protein [Luteimonas sp.]|nr:FHA domain-containing protein [Luteimonas sp.]
MSSNQPESTVNAGAASEAEAPASVNVLRILSGLHAGASRDLAEQEMILVGSGDDCDIVLADQGVARHHALINLIGGMSSLRALDAPLRVDGQPLHPGDPVELRGLQRIQLGQAAIAFGEEDDPGWASLAPDIDLGDNTRAPANGMRKLPLVAALAVLSLASLAIFAAVMPKHAEPADPRSQLNAFIGEFQVRDGQVLEDAQGLPVLRGTVKDDGVRANIEKRVAQAGFEAALDLRSAEKIAADVSEVLRTQNINAKTRYMGNGVVEASGRFEDMDAMRAAASSRAMDDVPGVTKVLVRNYVEPGQLKRTANGPTEAAEKKGPTRIVALVRGATPHLVSVDGTKYPVGADVPGRGQLVSIGESAHVVSTDGMLHKIVLQPVTAAEIAAAAETQAAADAMAAGVPAAQGDAGAEAEGNATDIDRRVARASGSDSKSSKHDKQ